MVKQVEIVDVASLANRNIFYQFIHTYSYLPASPRPKTLIKFRLTDVFKLSLTNSPSPLKPTVWATLLSEYPGGLGIYLSMTLCFRAKLGYGGSSNPFILSDNLASALEDPAIIAKKLKDDLASCRVKEVQPNPPFIYSPLGLVLKHDGDWRKIHHFSYPPGKLIHDYIPDGADKLRYTRFQEILKLVILAGRNSVILKKNIKNALRNMPVAPQHQ